MESQLGLIKQSFDLRYSEQVREALNELPDNFIITDPFISGHPIVFASNGLLKMFGYSKDEVIGRNGRMFQGPETDRRSVMEIREAIREERGLQISLLNYRKDGRPFWLLFHMCPVFDKDEGRVIHFVGVQVPIRRRMRGFGCNLNSSVVNLCESGAPSSEGMFRCCRREVCLDTIVGQGRASAIGLVSSPDDREVEINEPCEASEIEKQKANAAVSNILSVLTHYSELTGKLVSGKRCCLSGTRPLVSSSLNISLGRIKQSFVLSDPHLPDMPIVYASDTFLELTGYDRYEVLGRNCRFLSGNDTDPATQYQIKECIRTEQPCTVRILNYRKDKTLFWNLLHISPVRNAWGKVAYFVGVQIDDSCKNQEEHPLSPQRRQLSVVGAVKVAVRSLSINASTS